MQKTKNLQNAKNKNSLFLLATIVLMSFTSDLLLFIKHATKSVGSALPIRIGIILTPLYQYRICIFLTIFMKYIPSANKVNAGRKEYLLANILEP